MFKKLEVIKAKDHYYVNSDTHFITDNFNEYGEAIDGCPLKVMSHKSNNILGKLDGSMGRLHWEFEDYDHAKSECDYYNEELEMRFLHK
tara:strand:+ start:47 stop:313 length:267 start_codon:yes stop_codon:yes gene_type:complete